MEMKIERNVTKTDSGIAYRNYDHKRNEDITESVRLGITDVNRIIIIGRAMAQAVSLSPLTAEGLVRARVSLCGICGRQSGTGTAFLRVLWLSF
jgi:hypothetical protein